MPAAPLTRHDLRRIVRPNSAQSGGMRRGGEAVGCGGGRRRQCGVLRGAGGARERRQRADGRARAEGADGRQFALHRGRVPLRLRRRRRPQGHHAGPDQGGGRALRLRHLHHRPVLRRHVPHHQLPHRRRPVRPPGRSLARRDALAAWEGHEVRPDLGPPGLSDRRQVQVLGRPHRRIQGRRSRPGRAAPQASRRSRASRSSTAPARSS